MKNSTFTKTEIFILLLLILETFIKTTVAVIVNHPEYFDLGNKNLTSLRYYSNIFSLMNCMVLMILSIYLLVVKKVNNPIYLIICYMLIFKATMHFIVFFKIYKKFDLSLKTQEKIILFKKYESTITNITIALFSGYFLSRIF
jgi:hypothetical protein